eukprot:scaffold4432_cov76-Cyclotella_meneghiniana.AAC.3
MASRDSIIGRTKTRLQNSIFKKIDVKSTNHSDSFTSSTQRTSVGTIGSSVDFSNKTMEIEQQQMENKQEIMSDDPLLLQLRREAVEVVK